MKILQNNRNIKELEILQKEINRDLLSLNNKN